jgi:hypothetical protein
LSKSRHRGISDAQANAEALARRETPHLEASKASIAVAWDFRERQPSNLREAVHFVRVAYADEVPAKLHDGPDAIGEGGTPRMSARAEGYLFGRADASDGRRDPVTGELELVSFYHAPFRATLDRLSRGNATDRRIARIVAHITIGQRAPIDAATEEGAHRLDALLVAETALRAFLRQLTDVKIAARAVQRDETAGAAAG